MARNIKKKTDNDEIDVKEFFAAIAQIEQEKGIKKDYMKAKIIQALTNAYKHDHSGLGDNLIIEADEQASAFRMYIRKEVVETVTNPDTEISLEDCRNVLPNAQLGDIIRREVKPKNFGRLQAQTARQVIIQGIREAEQDMVYNEFNSKGKEILTGIVSRIDEKTGSVIVRLGSGSESITAFLSTAEQVPGEEYHEGERIKVYVVEVRKTNRGPQVVISRSHPGLVTRLFELNVPEINDGTVEICGYAREAGNRTKLAVISTDPQVDAIGACVGKNGQRVAAIVEELRGEKVDIIPYSDDPEKYIAAALAPAEVLSVITLSGEGKSCRVIVPDDQLSLAIGKEGKNARLAAKLTGYKIDIKPESAQNDSTPDESNLIADDADAE